MKNRLIKLPQSRSGARWYSRIMVLSLIGGWQIIFAPCLSSRLMLPEFCLNSFKGQFIVSEVCDAQATTCSFLYTFYCHDI